ncbi:ATP-binding protein [Treponema socranskii]|uniref:ATP-binding protein n=1 Tax=Treponema socranskii TaxID=53419 RepID=UPI003D6FFB2E
MGTIFIAGSYGVGKSILCTALSKTLAIPAFSAGDLISNVNGERYGANKAVQNKDINQSILVLEVKKKLEQYSTILLAGHFYIFDKLNRVEKLPHSVFKKISIEQILLLEAAPERILSNLSIRDKKRYEYKHIELLAKEEQQAAKEVSQQYGCSLHIHQMSFDESDLQKCCDLLNIEVQTV